MISSKYFTEKYLWENNLTDTGLFVNIGADPNQEL